jgi:hypothetical protein
MSHDWTPLHWTWPRMPTVPAHAAMFEHESWQSLPHVGLHTLAPLQSMLHDAPHVPVHAWPFMHWTMQLLPVQSLLEPADDVEPEAAVDDVELGADVAVVNVAVEEVEVELLGVDADVFAPEEDDPDAVLPASSYALQSKDFPPHADVASATRGAKKSARIP